MESTKVYAAVQNGQVYKNSFGISKQDLLIGFDMISLNGLEQCEQRLLSKGITIEPVTVSVVDVGEHICYAGTLHGKLNAEMLAYSTCRDNPEQSMDTTALYLEHNVELTANEKGLVQKFYWFPRHDGRRKRTWEKLKTAVNEVFDKYGVKIVPIAVKIT